MTEIEKKAFIRKNIKEFKDADEMLTELNARPHGRYFLCTCPECNHHEAYMYKDKMNLIFCNRQNECGETTRVILTENDNTSDIQEKYKNKNGKKWLSKAEKEELKILTANMRYFIDGNASFDMEKGETFRGISRGVYQNHLLVTPDLKFGSRLLNAFPLLMRRYGQSEESIKRFENRDVVIPFFDEKGQVDRLLLRSTSPDVEYSNEYPKEIHCIVQYQKQEVKNFQHNLTKEGVSPILISETLINALSVKEIDHDVEFIAATGVNHVRQMKEYILENKEIFQERGVVLAFDPDKAGNLAKDKLKTILSNENIPTRDFPYDNDIQDMNDVLQHNDQNLKELWDNTRDNFQKQLAYINEFNLAIDNIARYQVNLYNVNFDEEKADILKDIKTKNKIYVAYKQDFQESLGEYEVTTYFNIADMTLEQEFNDHDQKYTLVIQKYESPLEFLADTENLSEDYLTNVSSEQALKEKAKFIQEETEFFLRQEALSFDY
ncbi:toprim domain-containing protein [Listeria sp. FSL L7-1426]|uniref:toprim domain-containing protein n=1 Tax=Listeria cossartiae TaxID=2838249 RepID=UPI0016256601|nr:toprim domain-containing protein [Listeria cossartiae]MBC1572719.1 toprim domain-containing protein [Listeria cossartiae subsp. cossartiae]